MIDLNDPRLTAYALDELDEAERQELKDAIDASPELQREVAAIQQSADLLHATLGAESCPVLTDAQRAAIEAESDRSSTVQLPNSSTSSGWSVRRVIALAVVASLLLIVGTAFMATRLVDLPLKYVAQHFPQAARDATSNRNTSTRGEVRDEMNAVPRSVGGFSSYSDDAGRGRDEFATETEIAPGRFVVGGGEEPPLQQKESQISRPSGLGDDRLGSRNLEAASSRMRSGESRGFDSRRQAADPAGLPAEPGGDGQGADRSGELPTDAPTSSDADFVDGSVRSDVSDPQAQSSQPGRQALPSASNSTHEVSDLPAVAASPVRPISNPLSELEQSSTVRSGRELPAGEDGPRPSLVNKPQPAGPATEDLKDNLREVLEKAVAEVSSSDEEVSKRDSKRNAAAKRAKSKRTTWVRSRATPNASQLMIGDRDGLPLEGMQVNVLVDGFRARVLLDLYFYNNRGGRFEGNFKLRLPNEASLYYFAFGQSAYEYRPMVDQLASKGFLTGDLIRAASLDPRGIMESRQNSWTDVKVARVVPREKAAQAYSETVRRRVDPALVEWSGAGVFNARVFPLMPNKLHRVVVGYDVNLQQQGDDLVYALDLPVDQGECVVDLNVSAMPGVTAEVTPGTRPFVSGGRAYYNFKDPKGDAINVRFKNAGSMLLAGSDESAGDFFVSRLTPDLPGDETNASSSRAMFLLDTSLSSRPEKFNAWLDMLKAVLSENRDSIDEFAVLFFNIESNWWQDGFRKNNAQTVDQLLADCHKLSLEGATDLRQALQEATAPEWAQESAADNSPRPDLFLLSDGAVTWGEMNVHQLSQTLRKAESGPLFAYQTGMTGTAVGVLEHLTRETGGAVFSVVNQDEVPQAARAHRQRPWQLVDVAMPGGTDLLVAGRPKFVYPGQSLLVTGRGRPDAEATVRVRRGDQQKVVEVTIDRTVDSTLAPRVYGQVAVGQLEDLGSKVEDVSIAYARHFRVTGQTCSLLMLESEADYQRFNIKPEEDSFLVRTSPSADLIKVKLDELADQLGDAKSAMTDWLSKLERTPGLQFKLPTALRLVLDRLPREAFEVDQTLLVASQLNNDDTPKEFARQLDSGKLDYDAVSKRASDRFEQLGPADALRTLSSLIENNPGDPVLTRDVAFSALEWGLGGQAYYLLKRVSEMRPYEPQTYQAMSLCLAETGNADLAMVYYEVAMNATWHNRYLDVKKIVGVEYVDLLRRIERGELQSHAREFASARLQTMRGRVPVNKADLVVTMMWNTDRTDVDLHVIEPSGEECYYEHPRTRMGGQVTRDVTEGFGPEMYTLPQARSGDYRILANYFGTDVNRTNVRSKVYVTVYRNYGDPKRQWVERKTITLANRKEKRELMTVKVKE